MRFTVERHGIRITPESDLDVAYIEDTLGLRVDGSSTGLYRHNAMGLSCVAFLSTAPRRDDPERKP